MNNTYARISVYCFLYVDLVCWDPPFGIYSKLEGCKWDTDRLSVPEITSLLKQLHLMNNNKCFLVYVHVSTLVLCDFIAALTLLEKDHSIDVTNEMFYWHKTRQSPDTPKEAYTHSILLIQFGSNDTTNPTSKIQFL